MKISRGIPLLAVLLGASQMGAAQDTSPRFKVGQPFPDLILPSAEDGQPTSLAQYRGKKVLLHIFASW
jgi:hypothetical protein